MVLSSKLNTRISDMAVRELGKPQGNPLGLPRSGTLPQTYDEIIKEADGNFSAIKNVKIVSVGGPIFLPVTGSTITLPAEAVQAGRVVFLVVRTTRTSTSVYTPSISFTGGTSGKVSENYVANIGNKEVNTDYLNTVVGVSRFEQGDTPDSTLTITHNVGTSTVSRTLQIVVLEKDSQILSVEKLGSGSKHLMSRQMPTVGFDSTLFSFANETRVGPDLAIGATQDLGALDIPKDTPYLPKFQSLSGGDALYGAAQVNFRMATVPRIAQLPEYVGAGFNVSGSGAPGGVIRDVSFQKNDLVFQLFSGEPYTSISSFSAPEGWVPFAQGGWGWRFEPSAETRDIYGGGTSFAAPNRWLAGYVAFRNAFTPRDAYYYVGATTFTVPALGISDFEYRLDILESTGALSNSGASTFSESNSTAFTYIRVYNKTQDVAQTWTRSVGGPIQVSSFVIRALS